MDKDKALAELQALREQIKGEHKMEWTMRRILTILDGLPFNTELIIDKELPKI